MSIEDNLRSRIFVKARIKPNSCAKRSQSFLENAVLNEESIPIPDEEKKLLTEDMVNKLYDEDLGDFKGVEQDEIISAYENGCLVAGMTMDEFIEYVNRPDLSEDF